MAKASPGITALNAGELTPLLAMANDFNKYRNGLRRCRNFLPTVQGPIYRRPGWRYVAAVKNSDDTTWLARFEYSADVVFILEFGDGYIRFFAERGRVVEASQSITSITKANPGVVGKNAHGYLDGQDLELSGITGMLQLAGRSVRVANKTANTFELHDLRGNAIDTTNYGTFTAGDMARVYEIETPWTAADLTNADGTFALTLVQSLDTVYITHASKTFQPRKLIRNGATNWSLTAWKPINGPFYPIDFNGTVKVYASAAGEPGDSITLQADGAIFEAGHVGGLFMIEQNSTDSIKAWEVGKSITAGNVRRSNGNYYEALNTKTTGSSTPVHTEGARLDGDDGVQWQYLHSGYGWAEITAVTDSDTAVATVVSRIPSGAVGSGNKSIKWAHGFFSDAEGWPSHVAFFRERLALLRDEDLWHSVERDYENYLERDAGVVAADLAFRVDLRSERSNTPLWMIASDDLLIGTSGGVFAVSEISTAQVFGPGNAAAIEGPGYGARAVPPVKINSFLLYTQRSGRKVREIRFDANTNGYVALNRTVLAEHIAKGRIVSASYQAEPDTIMWAACANGDLLSFTFDPEHEVQAWGKHPIGGTDAKARCVLAAPCPAVDDAPAADYDDIWAINSRTIDGETWQYVEVMAPKFDGETMDLADAEFMDSCLTARSDTPFTVVGNAWHLEGQTVRVMKNGAAHPNCVVENGQFTLNGAATIVTFGLGYKSIAETMSLEAGAVDGTAQGKKKRIHKVFFRVLETVKGFLAGSNDATKDRVGGVSPSQQTNSAPDLVTGDLDLDWPGDYENASYVLTERDDAFPYTLLGVMPQLVAAD